MALMNKHNARMDHDKIAQAGDIDANEGCERGTMMSKESSILAQEDPIRNKEGKRVLCSITLERNEGGRSVDDGFR